MVRLQRQEPRLELARPVARDGRGLWLRTVDAGEVDMSGWINFSDQKSPGPPGIGWDGER